MAETLQPFCFEAHTLHSGSISFGRFETEPLSWERRSAFSCNNYLEEVERYSKSGSVNQRKAYFEVFFKRKGLLLQPDSQCPNQTECQSSEGEHADGSNHMELHRENLSECDKESSNSHRDCEVTGKNPPMQGKFSPGLRKPLGVSPKVGAISKISSTKMKTSSSNVVARENKLPKENIPKFHSVKQSVRNVSTSKSLLAKTPKSMEYHELEKQKQQHARAKVKELGRTESVLQSNKRTNGSITGQSASRPQNVARSSTGITTKPSAANINSNSRRKEKNKDEGKETWIRQMPKGNNSKTARMPPISPTAVPQDSGGEKAVPLHAETAKLGTKSSDPVRKVTRETESISSSAVPSNKPLGQPSPSKIKENNLPTECLHQRKQVDPKKGDLSPSETVTTPSKVPKLQSESSSPSPVGRAPSVSSTSSAKQLSSKLTDRTESPRKSSLPTNYLPEGQEVTAGKFDVGVSQAVSNATRLAKLQHKWSSLSPVLKSPGASSTSLIKQLSSRRTDSTESPMKNNSASKCLPIKTEVNAKKHEIYTSQTVSKPTKAVKLQWKSASPSSGLKALSASSTTSSTNQLSSQHIKRTESPRTHNFPTNNLSGGKEITVKIRGLGISQTVSKPTKLVKLLPNSSTPHPVLNAPNASSTSSSLKQLSSQCTYITESPLKNNLPRECPPGGKEVASRKQDLDSSRTVSRPTKLAKMLRETSSPVVKAATTSSTSSTVGQFTPQPKKETEVPRKNNEKEFPTKWPPEAIEANAKNGKLDLLQSVSKPTKLAKLQQESSSPGSVHKVGGASMSSIGQHTPKTMNKRETPKKNRNETKQLGANRHIEYSPQSELVSSKSSILEVGSSNTAKGDVSSIARTNPIKSVCRV